VENELLTPEQVGKILQVNEKTVRGYCGRGQLQSVRLSASKGLRIKREWVDEMVERLSKRRR
jgi:predicted site-specific integrase-resolvase